ncbi:MAG: ABC transporter permease [Lachnospiraceae bacterium]
MRARILSMQVPEEKLDFSPLPRDFYLDETKQQEETSYWKEAWKRLRKNKIAMVSLAVILFLILFAFVGPYLVPYTYDQQVRGDENLWPCASHWFGTDRLGRDLLVRCMIGTRISLIVGLVSAVIVLVIGSIYGAISGLAGGMVDVVMMRIAEIIYSVPEILLIVVIKLVIDEPLDNLISTNAFFRPLQRVGSGLIAIFIVYGLLYWVGMARIVRGQVLQLKEMEYITASRALGAGRNRLIFGHLLPNCMGQLIATAMLQIPSAIFSEAFLSFLGMGVSAPMASLGSLTSEALNSISSRPYRMIFPAVIISMIILAFNLFGDGLRDALDPKMKSR